MTVADRCRAALLAKGLEATPENLSRVSGLSLEDAAMFLSMGEPPEIVSKFAKAAKALDVRLIWLSTGATRPQISEAFKPEEMRAFDLLSDLDASNLRRWLRFGGRLVKNR